MKFDFTLTAQQRSLVERHLHLVRWTIQRYIDVDERVLGLGYDDLYQEGCLGLCSAAATYSKTHIQFSTYAITVIRNHLIDHCRTVALRRRKLPSISLAAADSDRGAFPDAPNGGCGDDIEHLISELDALELLSHYKALYRGVARLGIEAMEWKVKGLSGAEIAKLYNTKPNHVGAWISRAAQKLRAERDVRAYRDAYFEKEADYP